MRPEWQLCWTGYFASSLDRIQSYRRAPHQLNPFEPWRTRVMLTIVILAYVALIANVLFNWSNDQGW
jgi:hypothetical protein